MRTGGIGTKVAGTATRKHLWGSELDKLLVHTCTHKSSESRVNVTLVHSASTCWAGVLQNIKLTALHRVQNGQVIVSGVKLVCGNHAKIG